MKYIVRQYWHFVLALSFLTRVPVPRFDAARLRLSHAVVYFPFIGLFVGCVGAGLFWVLHWWFPTTVSVAITLGALMLLTGALHEDGLADTFDAFGSKTNREDILAVLHDSRIGTYAGVALIVALLVKFSVLGAAQPYVVVIAFLLGHMLSRWAMLPVLFLFPYPQATAAPAKRFVESVASVPRAHIVLAALYVAGIAYFVAGLLGLALFAVVTLLGLGMARYFYRKIRGVSGDCYGAIQQCSEVLVYLLLYAFLT